MSALDTSDERRLEDLEVKFSFQQDTIESLNDIVTKQWQQIDQLKRQIERIEGRMQEMAEASPDAPLQEPPPPHY